MSRVEVMSLAVTQIWAIVTKEKPGLKGCQSVSVNTGERFENPSYQFFENQISLKIFKVFVITNNFISTIIGIRFTDKYL